MKLIPISLLWRTLGVLVAALVLSQIVSLALLNEFITRPRMAMGVGQLVSHLKTISAALETLPPHQQREFIARIAEKEGIRIFPSDGPRDQRFGPRRFTEGPQSPEREAGELPPRFEQGNPRGLLLAPDVPPMRNFRERLRAIFGTSADIYVRPENPNIYWISLPSGERKFWIVFPRSRIDRDPIGALVGWGIAGVIIALLATILIVWRLTRPLAKLARSAEALGRGVDPPAVPETGPSEIRAVARAFNQMKEDLKRNERERATFLAGVSHDLRTPLARLRLDVEMLDGKVESDTQRDMVADIDDMNAIIDQFTDFARSEAAEPLSPVNLSSVAKASAERAARGGAMVKCELADVPVLMLRPLATQRVVDNLIGNALKHAGGEVLLRTKASEHEVSVSVLDRGPGIAPDQVERLKQPFTRKDEARSGLSGAGLGLAIVNRIATVHGAKFDLLARDGGGLEARVMFPVSN